ncbi:LPS assembly lipoprotein LptE [Dongia sp.]|uniref:LPS assembly lipoprotein LptE n=1 Tax=Dongia sp. TaxID=1977262 RepID=UPI0035AD991D
MSWSRRDLLRFGLAGTTLMMGGAALAACGFRPLYGQASTTPNTGATVDAHLAAIKVAAPVWERSASPFDAGGAAKYDARTSQILHNALRDALNPYGQPATPAYNLSMELTESVASTLSAEGGDIDRYNLTLIAHFRLGDAAGEELLLEDIGAFSAFAVVNDPYIDIVSRNDARDRAARQLAELLKFRLSAYFTQNG